MREEGESKKPGGSRASEGDSNGKRERWKRRRGGASAEKAGAGKPQEGRENVRESQPAA